RFRHLIVVFPGAVILVPLPHVPIESHLPVDLELMHVYRFAEKLHDRLDHPRMAGEFREPAVIHVCGEIGAHRVAVFFADILRTPLCIDRWYFIQEDLDLLSSEQAREKQVAVAVKLFALFFAEFHAALPKQIYDLICTPGSDTTSPRRLTSTMISS